MRNWEEVRGRKEVRVEWEGGEGWEVVRMKRKDVGTEQEEGC